MLEGLRTGYVDPLACYFSNGLLVGPMGGLRVRAVLDLEAVSIPVYLNEWVRFDQPGHYRVYARSLRVQRQVGDHAATAPVVSERLNLEIVEPEPAWALAQLSRPLEEIRFLGSSKALQILARRLVALDEDAITPAFGLLGARDHELAEAALNKALASHAANDSEIGRRVLAYLRVRRWFVLPLPELEDYLEGPNYVRDTYADFVRRAYSIAFDAAHRRVLEEFPLPKLLQEPVEAEHMPARDEIRSDLLRLDSPRLHVNVLLSLPDKYLFQLELHFADRARHNPWLFGRLGGKYGSSKILPAVRSIHDAGHLHWGCDSRIGFLGYFLRFAPGDEARDILGGILEREGNGCYRSFFTALRQVPWAPTPMA
jgi:hypothetical protein